jgi:hypothetical protein
MRILTLSMAVGLLIRAALRNGSAVEQTCKGSATAESTIVLVNLCSVSFPIAFRFRLSLLGFVQSQASNLSAEFCGERLTRRERLFLSWFLFLLFLFLKGSD